MVKPIAKTAEQRKIDEIHLGEIYLPGPLLRTVEGRSVVEVTNSGWKVTPGEVVFARSPLAAVSVVPRRPRW